MNDAYVVRNDISERGLRRLHLIRAGKKLDVAEVLSEYGIGAESLKAWIEYEEKELGMWHLRIYWRDDEKVG